MLLILAVVFTLALNAFAIRTSLPPHRLTEAARSRRSLRPIVTRASAATDVEMVGMLERENALSETALPSPSQSVPPDYEESAATAKSRVAEIFKVQFVG